MTIHDRVAMVRKRANLTTRAFASKINITGGSVTNMEKGVRNVTDRIIADICREFCINENWLRMGEGEMFSDVCSISLDAFAKKQNLTELERDIIKVFIGMDSDTRNYLTNDISAIFKKYDRNGILTKNDRNAELNKELERLDAIEKELREHRRELEKKRRL